MHIHSTQLNTSAAGFYSSAQQMRAASAQQAAEVRRKLLKSTPGVEDLADPEETLLIGHWLDSQHHQGQSDDEYHAGTPREDMESD